MQASTTPREHPETDCSGMTTVSIFESDIEKIAVAGITAGCNPPTNNRLLPQ